MVQLQHSSTVKEEKNRDLGRFLGGQAACAAEQTASEESNRTEMDEMRSLKRVCSLLKLRVKREKTKRKKGKGKSKREKKKEKKKRDQRSKSNDRVSRGGEQGPDVLVHPKGEKGRCKKMG